MDYNMGLRRMEPNVGPYAFPDHLTTRRLGEVDSPDVFYRHLQPRQNYRNTHHPTNGTINHVDHLATDRMTPVRNEIPLATLGTKSRTAPNQSGFVADGKNGRVQADEEKRLVTARALAANQYLGYQRFVFTLTKYPALIMTMVALWNVAGRGQGMPKTSTENGAYYSAIVTAGMVFVTQMLFSSPHHNSYTKAKGLSYLYHLSMLLAFSGAALCIILASINFKNYQDYTQATTCKYVNNAPCYSNQERVAYLGVLVGCGSFILLLSVATIMYGGIGLGLMKKRLREEYAKLTSEGTYFNNGFEY
ncbi:hypothetical protein OESDEN_20071 [Oesophagostomum dentatum]|uniref:Uncharacterized protein n=1 Tax=Oesophagostomum dentatum TaxID=61180 RepID=A0A0B1S9Q2_OESDE|nr:hypothetical protein OESDEN_20071 [Oesophagostomum dentatum]